MACAKGCSRADFGETTTETVLASVTPRLVLIAIVDADALLLLHRLLLSVLLRPQATHNRSTVARTQTAMVAAARSA